MSEEQKKKIIEELEELLGSYDIYACQEEIIASIIFRFETVFADQRARMIRVCEGYLKKQAYYDSYYEEYVCYGCGAIIKKAKTPKDTNPMSVMEHYKQTCDWLHAKQLLEELKG